MGRHRLIVDQSVRHTEMMTDKRIQPLYFRIQMMMAARAFLKTLFMIVGVIHVSAWGVSAQQVLILSELNPKTTHFSAFNSYKHKLLLISLIQKEKASFECLPNKYLFYDFDNEDYFEINGGNLKIDNTYTKIFKTQIHFLGGVSQKNQSEWEKRVKTLLKTLNVSAQTLENGKMINKDKSVVCWQQPELLDIKGQSVKKFPFLAANLCKSSWCSELYWTDPHQIRFWVQIDPRRFHLMRLNIDTEKTAFIKDGPKFMVPELKQANAPRDNLVNQKNIFGKTMTLNSGNGVNIQFSWKLLKNGHIRVILLRSKSDVAAAMKMQTKIDGKIREKRLPEALQLIRFALWLDPENQPVKTQRLIAYASLLMIDELYNSLKNDFTESQRFSACQKLHIDKTFKNLWKRDDFIKKFKENCS